MTGPHDRRIARALQLAAEMPEATEILRFYAELAAFQKKIFGQSIGLEGLDGFTDALIALLQRAGTPELKTLTPVTRELIERYWNGDRSASPPEQFLARVLLQPYAESLATRASPDLQTTA